MLKLKMLKSNLLKLPYFSKVKVKWKEASYNSLYQKALNSVGPIYLMIKGNLFIQKIR